MRLNRLILKIFSYFFRAANPYSYVQRSHRLPCNVPTYPWILSTVIHTEPLFFPQNPYKTELSCSVPTYQIWCSCSIPTCLRSYVQSPHIQFSERATYPHVNFGRFLHRAAYPHMIVQRSHIPKPRLCTGNVDNFWPLFVCA